MTGPVLLILRAALVLALYAFLVWVFLLLWRELRHQASWLAAREIPPLNLRDAEHPQDLRYSFSSSPITIGRSAICECPIDDETISSQHARLMYQHRQWWVADLGSTNGTFLNDERIMEETVLTSGDRLRIGQVTLTVTVGDRRTKPLA